MLWPPLLLADTTASLLGFAAIVTAIGGSASTIMALRKNRSEEHEECLKHLKEARAEAEALAAELHDLKLKEKLDDED